MGQSGRYWRVRCGRDLIASDSTQWSFHYYKYRLHVRIWLKPTLRTKETHRQITPSYAFRRPRTERSSALSCLVSLTPRSLGRGFGDVICVTRRWPQGHRDQSIICVTSGTYVLDRPEMIGRGTNSIKMSPSPRLSITFDLYMYIGWQCSRNQVTDRDAGCRGNQWAITLLLRPPPPENNNNNKQTTKQAKKHKD